MSYKEIVKCDRCDFQAEYWTKLIYYHLPSGHQIMAPAMPIWCRDCNRLTSGEWWPAFLTVEGLEEQIDERKTKGVDVAGVEERSAFLRTPLDPQAEYERQVGRLQAQLEWIRSRESPMRCLRCFGTNFFGEYNDNKPLPHPPCGGLLLFEGTGGHCQPSRFQDVGGEGMPIPGGDNYIDSVRIVDLRS